MCRQKPAAGQRCLLSTTTLTTIFFTLLSCSPIESLNDYSDRTHKNKDSSMPCFARYALESFFREYDSFTNSNVFEHMSKNAVGSKTKLARLLDIERHLIGEGSHRHLSSIVRFSIQANLIADVASQICDFIIIERLPFGVFADPFELQHLLRRGVFKDAAVFGDTNLELPSFLSNQSTVEVHLDAALDHSAGQEILLEYKIEIPLHARYPPVEESGYAKVRFGAPDLFIYCKMDGQSPGEGCLFSSISGTDAGEVDDIVWSIPAGIKAHARMVSIITFSSALLSAALIIVASLRSSPVGNGFMMED
ncbi:uncharacterized protein LOC130818811 isoform X2 [Amaranthus tricolor]|uniref:uncharacterized protein LOC130818811 isoform X2 n=1 Tax=Amaranthus tricolor TaxID=29722 RepID=UPI002589FAA5|nr:uncharacterized protein LOC130818811 isoform X2 [Amaranthus tricolor]